MTMVLQSSLHFSFILLSFLGTPDWYKQLGLANPGLCPFSHNWLMIEEIYVSDLIIVESFLPFFFPPPGLCHQNFNQTYIFIWIIKPCFILSENILSCLDFAKLPGILLTITRARSARLKFLWAPLLTEYLLSSCIYFTYLVKAPSC